MHNNQTVLEKGSYRQLLKTLCLPTVIIMLVLVFYNMADTFFIGHTGDPNKIAAVSLCAPVFSILSAFGTLFGNGGCTLISISLGENMRERIKAVSGFCFLGVLIISSIFIMVVLIFSKQIISALGGRGETEVFAIIYLRILILGAPAALFSSTFCNIVRADGAAAQSMIANLLGTIFNILLDALFILIFHWDVAGAALATVIGNCMTSLYLIIYIKKSNIFTLNPKEFFARKKVAFDVVSLGLPMTCSTLLMSFSSIISNHMMIGYGEVALSAQGIAGKFGMLIGMLAMGICMGLQPAISYAYGKKNKNRILYIIKRTAVFTFLIGTSLSVLGFIFRNQIIYSFINNDEVIRHGSIMIFGSLLTGPFVGWYQLSQTFLQSTGKPSYASFVALLDKGLIYIPMLLVMAHLWKLYGIAFSGSVTTLFSLMIAAFLCLKWYKNWSE